MLVVFGTAWVVHDKVDAVDRTKGGTAKLLTDWQLHLVKKALAIAAFATELGSGSSQSTSDHAESEGDAQ